MRFHLKRLALAASLAGAVALASCARDETRAGAAADAAPPEAIHYFDTLGQFTRPISSKNPEAQRWFDQGMRLTWGFNHQAAQRSFAEAAKHDPGCGICFWGQALVLGPNVNLAMQPEAVAPAWEYSRRALALASSASPAERALIEALAVRYAEAPPADRKPLDRAYADAMAKVVARYPDDLDAATLYAEALMDLSPWQYWDKRGEPTSADTPVIVSELERVLAKDPEHIGAIHYYVHATEASKTPEAAEPFADALAMLSPGSGHLVHMPAHTYIRVGRYHDATLNNLKATEADQHFLDFCRGTNGVYPLGYVPHNWHFIVTTAGLEGNSARAIHAADQTAARALGKPYDKAPLEFMQQFVVSPLLARVRFERWDELLAIESSPSPLPYPTAIWHYARGRAHLGTGALDAAVRDLAALERIAADPALAKVSFQDVNHADAVLKVAVASLRAELALARGARDEAIAGLEAAVAAEDALNYVEPPEWPLQNRHRLGAVLLDAGRAREAEAVHRSDLVVFPKNGWSLYGLAESLAAQGRAQEAEAARAQHLEAWQWADTSLASSH
jgi:tetratricopeptide (TPR) repeat protein